MSLYLIFGIIIELALIYYTFIFEGARSRLVSGGMLIIIPPLFLVYYKHVRIHDYNRLGLGFETMGYNLFDCWFITCITCTCEDDDYQYIRALEIENSRLRRLLGLRKRKPRLRNGGQSARNVRTNNSGTNGGNRNSRIYPKPELPFTARKSIGISVPTAPPRPENLSVHSPPINHKIRLGHIDADAQIEAAIAAAEASQSGAVANIEKDDYNTLNSNV
jgi:hypothetical protein